MRNEKMLHENYKNLSILYFICLQIEKCKNIKKWNLKLLLNFNQIFYNINKTLPSNNHQINRTDKNTSNIYILILYDS